MGRHKLPARHEYIPSIRKSDTCHDCGQSYTQGSHFQQDNETAGRPRTRVLTASDEQAIREWYATVEHQRYKGVREQSRRMNIDAETLRAFIRKIQAPDESTRKTH